MHVCLFTVKYNFIKINNDDDDDNKTRLTCVVLCYYNHQEEKAELKAQNYLMEKEKRALELRLSGKESQEQAYLVQIEHLKCEVKEQQRLCRDPRYRKSMVRNAAMFSECVCAYVWVCVCLYLCLMLFYKEVYGM